MTTRYKKVNWNAKMSTSGLIYKQQIFQILSNLMYC